MSSFVAAALALGVIASFVLIGAGLYGLRTGRMTTTRGWLMIGVGVITLLNILMIAPMMSSTIGPSS